MQESPQELGLMLSLGCDGSVSFSEALSSGIHLYAFLHADTQAKNTSKRNFSLFSFLSMVLSGLLAAEHINSVCWLRGFPFFLGPSYHFSIQI